MSFQKRFIDKISITGTCWLWTGAFLKTGYGQIERNNKTIRAHRASWELFRGEIPKGLCILHKCDNRACVKPAHLFLGTYQDNNDDMARKGRRVNKKRKISECEWKKILEMNLSGISQAKIAKIYDVSTWNINNIVKGMK